jgi:hypothetical protein
MAEPLVIRPVTGPIRIAVSASEPITLRLAQAPITLRTLGTPGPQGPPGPKGAPGELTLATDISVNGGFF